MPRSEVAETRGVCVKEDPMNAAVRDGEEDRSEWRTLAVEDHRWLAVELVLLHFKGSRHSPGRLDDERRDPGGAVERDAKIAQASDAPAFRAAIRDQHG